jgi:hypothetical protein
MFTWMARSGESLGVGGDFASGYSVKLSQWYLVGVKPNYRRS